MQDKKKNLIKKTSWIMTVFLVCTLMLCACSGSRAGTEITFSEESFSDAEAFSGSESYSEIGGAAISATGAEADFDQNPTDMREEASNQEPSIYVHVCGAVRDPGVYELSKDDRVIRAIEAAGGFTKDADEVAINQAGRLEDGQQIYVYTKEESEKLNIEADQTLGSDVFGEGESKKININTATKEELMTLTGIGEAKAKAIVEYREVHGSFQSVDELMKIDGIKEGVFRKISDDITI